MAFQETADHVLEASASVLARAHAIQTLAEKFPADIEARLTLQDRELLHRLRTSHVTELSRLAALIRMQLKPLIGASNSALPVTSLVSSAQETDNSLTRLLAGSYSQSEGEEMLHGLASQIERLERAIQAERADGR